MNSKHKDVIIKTAELGMAILNRIDYFREFELPPNIRAEACRRELTYPIAGVLSLVKEEHRHEIVENALDLACRITTPSGEPTTPIITEG